MPMSVRKVIVTRTGTFMASRVEGNPGFICLELTFHEARYQLFGTSITDHGVLKLTAYTSIVILASTLYLERKVWDKR